MNDSLTGTTFPGSSTYYYGNARYRARHSWPDQSLEDNIHEMTAIEDEDRITVRAEKAKSTGFTGLSLLHRLYHLYGFNVMKDLVYDEMHNVSMNVINQHLHHYLDNYLLSSTNKTIVTTRLAAMPWTAGNNVLLVVGTCTYSWILKWLHT